MNELRHKFRKISLTSVQVIYIKFALGAEVTRAEHRLSRNNSVFFVAFRMQDSLNYIFKLRKTSGESFIQRSA